MRHGRCAIKYLEACWRATAKSSIKILVHFPSSIGILVHFPSSIGILVHFPSSIGILVHFSSSLRIPVHFFGSIRIPVHFLGSFKIPTPFLRTHLTEIFLRIPKTAGFKMDKKPQICIFLLDTTGAILLRRKYHRSPLLVHLIRRNWGVTDANKFLVELIRRDGGVKDAMEYSGRVDTQKWSC